jgi:hypothetical protein
MQRFFKSVATIAAVSTFACVSTFFSAKSANAEQRMNGSYIGVGVAADGSGADVAGTFRWDLKPVSIRATAVGACEGSLCATLFIPTVTYDFGISKNANIYAGVGGSAISISDSNSSVSLGTGAVLQAGAEGAISQNVVLYGDGTYFTNGGGTIWKVGAGWKF